MEQLLRGPVVIGHRGASGWRPENTLAAFELAARAGADRLEPDVVPTADGVLVCRHDRELSRSTDVARRGDLAHLRTTKAVAGRQLTGWFVEDLTLAQVRTLRAVEPHPARRPTSAAHDGRYGVPTLTELLALAARLRAELARPLVVSVEVKEPAALAAQGVDVAALVLAELAAARGAGHHVVRDVAVQCFEAPFLRAVRAAEDELVLVQLARHGAAMTSRWALREVATYAEVLAPDKRLVLPAGPSGETTSLVPDAHGAGLAVHAWSAREPHPGEALALFCAGVDGVFADHPEAAVAAREQLRAAQRLPVHA